MIQPSSLSGNTYVVIAHLGGGLNSSPRAASVALGEAVKVGGGDYVHLPRAAVREWA